MSDVETRAEGGGSPASSSSEPLPQPPNGDGGCITYTTSYTQTNISVDPDANFLTFSAKTCSELLSKLSTDQLDFELRFQNDVLGRNLDFKCTRNPNKATKVDALSKLTF